MFLEEQINKTPDCVCFFYCFASNPTEYNFPGPLSAQWKVRTGCSPESSRAQQTAPRLIQKENVKAAP